MKKLILGIVIGGIVGAVLILVVLVLFEGKRSHPQDGLRLAKNDSTKVIESKKTQVLVYGDYMDLDSTSYLLIPLGMKTVEDQEDRLLKIKSSGAGDYSSESYNGSYRNYKYNFYSLDFGNCNNIIFYNKKTDESHLLLQKPTVISQFYFPHYEKEYTGKKYWFILLGIIEEDTNGDGYINNEDAEKVYIANLSGENMKQITPDNTQLVDWYIDMSTNSILMKVRYDTDNDKKFNNYDEIDILKTSIDMPSEGKQIINDEIKDNIKKILGQIK
jgi:gas vesicle protein